MSRRNALAGGQLAYWMRLDTCSAQTGRGGQCTQPSAAIWESPDSRNRSPLCVQHVDRWFDVCDDSPDLEPASVRWLDGTRALVGAA